MLDKIDVRDILKDHCRTMVLYSTGKTSVADLFLFFGIPIVVAGVSLWLGVLLKDAAVDVLITADSILVGLLFNLLVLIYTLAQRFEPPIAKNTAQQFLREIYSNVAYAILTCLITLFPLVALVVSSNSFTNPIFSAGSIALCVHIALTLLMILKRLHVLLSVELR